MEAKKIILNTYDDFFYKDVVFCGEDAIFIHPQNMGSKFTQENKYLRSIIVNKNGEVLSCSFPKFKNAYEDVENFPMPKSLENVKILTKIDGSTAIIDYVNEFMNVRTRGTTICDSLENREDFYYCLGKYPKIKEFMKGNSHLTLIFEITTPNQKIIIDYGEEPDFTFIGAVDKNFLQLLSQYELDKISKKIKVKRPEYHSFGSIEDIFEFCETNKNIEGFCIYFDNDQSIIKCKTKFYCTLHKLKSEISSFEKLVDFYVESGCMGYIDSYNLICDTIDFEIAEYVKGDLSNICDGMKEVKKIVDNMVDIVNNEISKLPTRKDQAQTIIQKWGNTNRASFAFLILDGKELEKDQIKKILYQVLKK